MKLIFIVGPPAVGKMTVGQALQKITDFKLFFNHMSLELVNQFFDFGTPPFKKLDKMIRFGIFEEVAKSNITGLIFTLVWAFELKEDEEYVDQIIDIFKKENKNLEVHIVELTADLKERLRRNKTENRLLHKASKRNVEYSENEMLANIKNHRMNSLEGEFPHKNIFKIDNTHLTPKEVAINCLLYTSPSPRD